MLSPFLMPPGAAEELDAMARIELRNLDTETSKIGGYRLLIDGKDVSDQVLLEGTSLTFAKDGRARLTASFAVDELSVDVEGEVS